MTWIFFILIPIAAWLVLQVVRFIAYLRIRDVTRRDK
jgi:hypothetical protein